MHSTHFFHPSENTQYESHYSRERKYVSISLKDKGKELTLIFRPETFYQLQDIVDKAENAWWLSLEIEAELQEETN